MAERVVNKNAVVGGMLLLLLCVLQCVHVVEGATHVVGGHQGWGFQAKSWIAGKKFKAGDTLVFNYNLLVHDVVVVSEGAYRSCSTEGSRPLTSGSNKFILKRGGNYFIYSSTAHCTTGMKIVVTPT